MLGFLFFATSGLRAQFDSVRYSVVSILPVFVMLADRKLLPMFHTDDWYSQHNGFSALHGTDDPYFTVHAVGLAWTAFLILKCS
jgi:hypothetical protein